MVSRVLKFAIRVAIPGNWVLNLVIVLISLVILKPKQELSYMQLLVEALVEWVIVPK